MFHDQIHVLLSLSFEFSHRKVDIVLSIDDIRTLANVVIVDPTPSIFDFMFCIILWGGCDGGNF